MKGLTPTAKTFELAGQMFRDAWDRRRSNTKEESSRYRTRLRQIDTEVSSLIDRAARTQHEETAHAYETRIAELRSETAALEEKLAQQAVPEGKFDEMFELSMKILASPCKIWEKGSYELKRTVLRMAFSDPLRVSRETGLRTAETTLPFKALRFLSTSERQMVRVEGLEPPRLAAPEPKSGASTNFATPASDLGVRDTRTASKLRRHSKGRRRMREEKTL